MITFVSSFYILKSKFSLNKYEEWFSNLLLNVKYFNLVIFTNNKSKYLLEKYINNNNNIKIILLELPQFYNYKYKDYWIKNHLSNNLLNDNSIYKTNWELNMLYSEKISFIKNVMHNKYFDTEWYGWLDIGYFRGRNNDIPNYMISKWPNHNKIKSLNKNKIHYGNVCNNNEYENKLFKLILNKNNKGLPINPIPEGQMSVAGGFFLIYKNNIEWWFETYTQKLELYFKNNYLVKDDQMIIIDCIVNNLKKFNIHKENNIMFDNWFMFQRILL